MTRLASPIAAALATVIALTSCASMGGATTSTATPSSSPTSGTSARDVLDQLPVKGRAPTTGYDRALFKHWTDEDGDGCDTRDEILARDSIDGSDDDGDGCIDSVSVLDPYADEVVTGRSNIDIDHVVALSDAWQKGAQQLTPAERQAFANDPLNLLAVLDTRNQQKGGSDAASWLPPNREYWCEFVARQITVKAEHELWVTQAEYDRMSDILNSCPDEPLAIESA